MSTYLPFQPISSYRSRGITTYKLLCPLIYHSNPTHLIDHVVLRLTNYCVHLFTIPTHLISSYGICVLLLRPFYVSLDRGCICALVLALCICALVLALCICVIQKGAFEWVTCCLPKQETWPLSCCTGLFQERIRAWFHNRNQLNRGPYERLT